MRMMCLSASLDQREYRHARYASAFACVRCGCTIFRYCSMDGVADGDAFLLCPECETRMQTTDDAARVLNLLLRNPMAAQRGFDRAALPFMQGYELPDVLFASGTLMRRTAFPIVFGGRPVIGLAPPEAYGVPVQLTVTLGAETGYAETIVNANEWLGDSERWRFRYVNGRYVFESIDGEAALVLFFGGRDRITVERLRTRVGSRLLEVDRDGARLDDVALSLPASDERVVGIQL